MRQIVQKQSAGDSVTHRTGLAGNATTTGSDFHIIGLGSACQVKGCQQRIPQHLGGKIVIYGPVIDGDLAGARAEINSCDGVLTASSGGMGGDGAHVVMIQSIKSGKGIGLGLLGFMRMLSSCINLELGEDAAP